jgi:hypothetical protein
MIGPIALPAVPVGEETLTLGLFTQHTFLE